MINKISIVVPVYNAEATLNGCVESIIKQTYQNWELWLIDDGSKDSSGEVCDKYSELDARIQTIHKVNAGVSAARNTGIEKANGEYVLFVDSDDYLEQDALKMAIDTAEKNDADVVMFGFFYYFKEEKTVESNMIEEMFIGGNDSFVPNIFSEVFSKELLNPPWNKLVKRSILFRNDIRFVSEFSICEDMIFTIEILERSTKIVFMDVPLYHYIYKKENNLVNKFHVNYFEALSFYISKVREYLLKYSVSLNEVSVVDTFYVNQTIAYFKKIYTSSGYGKQKKHEEIKRICGQKEFREALYKYVPKGVKKKVVVFCIKHRWYRLLHFLYAEVLCRKYC